MPVLLLLLGAGVLAWLWWRWRTTTLTRECRWREERATGRWRCASCGAETVAEPRRGGPRECLKPRGQQ